MPDTVEIDASYFSDFEVGRNAGRNAKTLCDLVAANLDSFNKLIVVQAASLVEVTFAEILHRAVQNTNEGLPNISKADQAAIAKDKTKNKHDSFDLHIRLFRDHGLLDNLEGGIYVELTKLKNYRNKVHIQKDVKIANKPRNENQLFNADVRDWSLSLTRKVIEFISKTYPRVGFDYVENFSIPDK